MYRSVKQLMVIARSFPAMCRKHGPTRTLRLGLREFFFDLWYRTDTSIEIPNSSPTFRNGNLAHEGSNPLIFSELLHHVSFDRETSVFLDFGAGKGRALFLAARHGFSRVIGVELSAELYAVAKKNLVAYRKRHPESLIEIHLSNAVDFEIPIDVNIAFFFNPFGQEVMHAVIDRIVESLSCTPREFHVIYLYPRFADLFVRAGFVPVYRQGMDGLVLRRS